ncbi:MAG: hypothetical protein M1840_006197 [Geoglossum simile]|nr:MAG: hypothetical protein M1840_006197 [Geoglossum simile]
MSGLKDVVKGGWHPKGKDGRKESWRAESKGINQVAGWVGIGKSATTRNPDHVSRPLSTLKDPAAFGPPPKRVIEPDTSGLGKPLAPSELQAGQKADAEAVEGEDEGAAPRPPRPPRPYLATDHLPKPPARRQMNVSTDAPPRPNLPPRLPPRQNSGPTPPLAHDTSTDGASLNQGALSRLGQAGLSVPGFNIGNTNAASGPAAHSTPPAPGGQILQLNGLQSRFSKLSTTRAKTDSPSEGTTLAQKQAALRTAQSLRNDPSSVSLADAQSAASTANNFRQRHGEQVAQGWKTADSLNKKYSVVDRANAYSGSQPGAAAPEVPSNRPDTQAESPSSSSTAPETPTTAGKRKPPPPPPKRREPGVGALPPPLPLASKPKPRNAVRKEQQSR